MNGRVLFTILALVIILTGMLQANAGLATYVAREPVPLPVWRSEVVAPGVDFSSLGVPSMALDPSGYPHIVYGDNFLFHTWFDGVSWRTETVDATHTGWRESVMAIDTLGTVIIAEIHDEQIFLHTLPPAGSWQKTLVPLVGSWNLSLALDSDGWPHIVSGPMTFEEKLGFHHARQTPTGWVIDVVNTDNAVDGPYAIALDSLNQPAILYEQHDESLGIEELWIARLSGDSWLHDRISAGCLIAGKSLVLDAQDKAHIAFSEHCDSKLTYAHEVDSGWQLSVVTDDGVHPSLALDSSGQPHLVFGAEAGQIYAILKDSRWEREVVQAGHYAGWYNTLVLDDSGVAHIASQIANLHYATNESGTWEVSTPARQETIGLRNALALDSSDVPHTLYHKDEVEELYWGSGSADQWQAELITQVSSTDLELAISVDTLDRPHIAYVDGGKDKLIVGLRQSGQWAMQEISAGGRRLSLATGSDNRPQLIIVQNNALVYWTKQGTDWVREVLVGPNSGIWRAWLALDSQNWPHIAYSGNNGSKYTFRNGAGTWVTEALPFETVDGLALGPGDKPFLLHSENEFTNPKYPFNDVMLSFAARDTGDGWRSESIWSEVYVDWDDPYWDGTARLAVDSRNRIHVAVRAAGAYTYDYLQRNEDGAWLAESPAWADNGDIGLALGHDNEPRLLTQDNSSLILSTREFIYLDKFALLPIVAR